MKVYYKRRSKWIGINEELDQAREQYQQMEALLSHSSTFYHHQYPELNKFDWSIQFIPQRIPAI